MEGGGGGAPTREEAIEVGGGRWGAAGARTHTLEDIEVDGGRWGGHTHTGRGH